MPSEQGNLLHFLSFTGTFEIIFDALLKLLRRKKSREVRNVNGSPILEAKKESIKGKNCISGFAITSLPYGNSCVHLACRGLQRKVVEKLLLAKIDASSQNESQKETPLHILLKADG